MTVRINGKPHDLPDDTTVAQMLRHLDLDPDGVAVAIDRRVVPRSAHAETPLRDGAEVEVIRAVGGG